MEAVALIGPSISIKGEVTSAEPLTIAGHVEGTISVEGHPLTIVEGGRVSATVKGDTIVVAGTVHGKLDARARIVVHATATIEGDLSAPAVSVADGAALQGRVQTGERRAKLQLAS